jgi:hypothetical protein
LKRAKEVIAPAIEAQPRVVTLMDARKKKTRRGRYDEKPAKPKLLRRL